MIYICLGFSAEVLGVLDKLGDVTEPVLGYTRHESVIISACHTDKRKKTYRLRGWSFWAVQSPHPEILLEGEAVLERYCPFRKQTMGQKESLEFNIPADDVNEMHDLDGTSRSEKERKRQDRSIVLAALEWQLTYYVLMRRGYRIIAVCPGQEAYQDSLALVGIPETVTGPKLVSNNAEPREVRSQTLPQARPVLAVKNSF